MQYGAMNFPVVPVVQEIEAFARLGFDYLELAMDPPMAHYSMLADQRRKIVGLLGTHNLGLVCHLPTFVYTADLTESLRQASWAEMLRSLETAADLGAQKVVLHPSMAGGMGGYVLEQVRGHMMEFLAMMADDADRLGVTICLENMFPRNRLGVEPDELEAVLSAFPAMKLTLDTGHANIGDRRGRRLKGFLDGLGDRIGHVHVSDNRGRLDDHLAVGAGTVKFTVLAQRLKELGYDATITLEVFDPDRTRLTESRSSLQQLLAATDG